MAGVVLAAGAGRVLADDHTVFLEWFESKWRTLEYRVPDLFMAGYSSVWLPPPCKAADPTSAGYDVFDRFDLGSPGSETAYGTQSDFQTLIAELHQSSALAYADWVMNHNAGRDGSNAFYNAGGYPGFALRVGSDLWGDFHDGTKQSFDPNAPNYDLWTGDLVGLIDIAQEKNYQYIRHPTVSGNPLNIPAGTARNKPDSGNTRFYPDQQLSPAVFVNPLGPPGATTFTVYPFNTADPSQGDPYVENATGLLCRATQWMVDVIRVDGFRLDAAKHIPQWFWNQYWDSYVFNRRITPANNRATPFSFGEIVDSNSFTQTYTRKDGFGNRDALDLNGAGQLRDILNAHGVGSWQNVLSAHLDNQDDGANNGTLGVNHLYSQDNGSAGNGSAPPPFPGVDKYALVQNCYLLFRPGPAIIYHNTRQFIDLYSSRGFWPREGNPTALGTEGAALNSDLVRLVQISNGYARGNFYPLNSTDPVNQSNADVLVFERRRDNTDNTHIANVVCAVNDSYSNGVTFRSIQTSFPAGTRLHELTGNHGDPVVDPTNQISELLTVDATGRILIPVPNNQNVNGVAHHKGYTVYGPAAPSGTLDILDGAGVPISNALPADPSTVASYQRRLTAIPIVTGTTFQIALTTNKTDPLDPDWDDNAFFRIDAGFPTAGGFADFNGTGAPDIAESNQYLPNYENFLTQKQPLASTAGAANGLYRQTINTDALGEGYHYIKVICFRRRAGNTDPIYTEFRRVIYVDRQPPGVTLANAGAVIPAQTNTFRVQANDRTIQTVYLMFDLANGVDPLTQVGPATLATRYDRLEWRRTISGLSTGPHTVTIVAFEADGRSGITTFNVNALIGDVNHDSLVTIDDLYLAYTLLGGPYDAAGDVNGDGQFTIADLRTLESLIRPVEPKNMATPQR